MVLVTGHGTVESLSPLPAKTALAYGWGAVFAPTIYGLPEMRTQRRRRNPHRPEFGASRRVWCRSGLCRHSAVVQDSVVTRARAVLRGEGSAEKGRVREPEPGCDLGDGQVLRSGADQGRRRQASSRRVLIQAFTVSPCRAKSRCNVRVEMKNSRAIRCGVSAGSARCSSMKTWILRRYSGRPACPPRCGRPRAPR